MRLFFIWARNRQRSALFPYTTLFRSDPLRLLRAVRLEDELGLTLDGDTERLVRDHAALVTRPARSEEHTSELQSHVNIVCRLLLEKKKGSRPHDEIHGIRDALVQCGFFSYGQGTDRDLLSFPTRRSSDLTPSACCERCVSRTSSASPWTATPSASFATTRRSSRAPPDRKSTRLNSSHMSISYAVFCLKKKKVLALMTRFMAFATRSSNAAFFHMGKEPTEICSLSLHDALPI